ncbi:MAG: acyl carrier protein [Gammaproteobacteria bacterium]|jgi:acyl carrier protein|nr:acyl carrier protein [Gammaproteobacteria bacterium]|tara:strand:+ start:16506 stop:16736 length:231 start_codon:yes stop_codon:yes gene_type:complete
MENLEQRLKKVFSESLGVDLEIIQDTLEYNTISEWDSIGHMSLIAAIEEEFDIMIETDDIIDMSSFKIAKDIVKKY